MSPPSAPATAARTRVDLSSERLRSCLSESPSAVLARIRIETTRMSSRSWLSPFSRSQVRVGGRTPRPSPPTTRSASQGSQRVAALIKTRLAA